MSIPVRGLLGCSAVVPDSWAALCERVRLRELAGLELCDPLIDGQRVTRKAVSLLDVYFDVLYEAGDGNVSRGVRRAVDALLRVG